MSKLTRESIEKARKLLDRKQGSMEEGMRREIEEGLARSTALASELKELKDAAREKRLDIEDNARSLARVTRKAKKSDGRTEAARRVDAKPERKGRPAESKKEAAPKATAKRPSAGPTPPDAAPDA